MSEPWKVKMNGRHPALETYAADDARITSELWLKFNIDHEARRRRALRLAVTIIMLGMLALACYAAWKIP